MWDKSEHLPREVRWHLIGHLQRNKVEKTLPIVHLIHSVDSFRLLHALDKAAQQQERPLPVLLEFNISGESTKQGFSPAHVPALEALLRTLKFVKVRGLMTMAALQDPESCRPTFAMLRRFARWAAASPGRSPFARTPINGDEQRF